MTIIDIAIILAILGFGAYAIFDRWCVHREEMFRMESQLEEIRCCYDSEQSFLECQDDPEHIASISPRLPSMTDEERAEIELELEAEANETA